MELSKKLVSSTYDYFSWLIELLAYWEGRVQPSLLASVNHISRQQASKKLGEFNLANPEALQYYKGEKIYRPTDKFSPRFITCEVGEYLNWVAGQSAYHEAIPANVCLTPPTRPVSPELMRPLIQALRTGQRIEVTYVSISNPNNEGRIIVPHHLVNTGQRWHLRAWCEKSQDFRDFVLGRFQEVGEQLGKSPITAEDDIAWQTKVNIIIAPDPRLTNAQRQVIEFEYGMHNGQLNIPTRACLVSYKLQLLNINPRIYEANAKAQQLIIVNKDDIKPWLFS
ncbi:MAG TPA: WYL domain-containing protein [Alcaligenaceae bacterium]|nr:WYL domain-containing protein [Alcaligenaceae bacterium]